MQEPDSDSATAAARRRTWSTSVRRAGAGRRGRGRCRTSRRPSGPHAGKAARGELPRSAHADWEPAPERSDPVELLEEQAQTRLPELGPIRYGRMLVSPFAFFRGGAYLMAADLAAGPRTGLHAQLCGDAHLTNFGIFAAPDRRLVFSLNDFDETLPGPFEWDVKRLAASFAVAGRERGFDERGSPRGGDGGGAGVPRGDGALRGDAEHPRLVRAARRRRASASSSAGGCRASS